MTVGMLLHATWTVPIAAVLFAVAAWYFHSLGGRNTPPSRRRVRRLSLLLVMLSLPVLVWVLSFVDPNVQPVLFISLWSIIFVLLLVIVALALLDMVNNFRLHHEKLKAELDEAAVELAEAMRRRQKADERSSEADH